MKLFNSRSDVIFTPVKSLLGLILGVYIGYLYTPVATPLRDVSVRGGKVSCGLVTKHVFDPHQQPVE